MFEVRERASHHLGVTWSPPLEPNGILTGYTLGYHEASKPGAIKNIAISDPMRRSYKVKQLTDSTKYVLYLWAMTDEGLGESLFIEDMTLEAGRKYLK